MVFATQTLQTYWEKEFKKQISLNEFSVEDNHFNNLSKKTLSKFNFEFYPQPFYGYFDDDMSNDILMPLINPGAISMSNLSKQFPTSTNEESKVLWNKEIYERHTGQWTKDTYHQKELEYDVIYEGRSRHWRGKKMIQVRNLLGQNIEFLHTIEFFPFHSDRWGSMSVEDKKLLYNLPSTVLSISALEDIASRRLVKHILGVGKPWVEILSYYSNLFKKVDEKILPGPKGNTGQRFYKYKPLQNPDGLPIVIYSASSMHIPNPNRNPYGAKIIYDFLEK